MYVRLVADAGRIDYKGGSSITNDTIDAKELQGNIGSFDRVVLEYI